MKKQLTKFLLVFAAVLCFSLSVSAQKDSDKKGERRPPKIIVPDKKESPKNNKPKDKDGKKNGFAFIVRGKAVINI